MSARWAPLGMAAVRARTAAFARARAAPLAAVFGEAALAEVEAALRGGPAVSCAEAMQAVFERVVFLDGRHDRCATKLRWRKAFGETRKQLAAQFDVADKKLARVLYIMKHLMKLRIAPKPAIKLKAATDGLVLERIWDFLHSDTAQVYFSNLLNHGTTQPRAPVTPVHDQSLQRPHEKRSQVTVAGMSPPAKSPASRQLFEPETLQHNPCEPRIVKIASGSQALQDAEGENVKEECAVTEQAAVVSDDSIEQALPQDRASSLHSDRASSTLRGVPVTLGSATKGTRLTSSASGISWMSNSKKRKRRERHELGDKSPGRERQRPKQRAKSRRCATTMVIDLTENASVSTHAPDDRPSAGEDDVIIVD